MATEVTEESNAFEETNDATSKCHLEAEMCLPVEDCAKNPHHMKFIPVDGLRIEHLPLSCQERELLDLVQAMADITVRVNVNHVSWNRPETVQGSDSDMSYLDYGLDRKRGTGWIYEVKIFQNTNSEVCSNSKNKTCYCKDCLCSSKPKSDYAEIKIITTDHVVYDELEAARTTCHLFFDRGYNLWDSVAMSDIEENISKNCPGVVTLWGMSDLDKDVVSKNVLMTYVTHDLGLAEKLNKKQTLCKRLMNIVSIKYPTPACKKLKSPPLLGCERDIWHALTVIVAHPHGFPQQVSFGRCAYIHTENGRTMYSYTTPTCAGSSGALAFIMGNSWKDWKQMNVHLGYLESNEQLNFCGGGFRDLIIPKRGEKAQGKGEEKAQCKGENKMQAKIDQLNPRQTTKRRPDKNRHELK